MSYTGNVNIGNVNISGTNYYQYISYGATGTFYSIPGTGTHSSHYINSYGPVPVTPSSLGVPEAINATYHGTSGLSGTSFYNGLSGASGTNSSNYLNSMGESPEAMPPLGPIANDMYESFYNGPSGASGTNFYNGLSGASGTHSSNYINGDTGSTINWPTGLNSIHNINNLWNNFSNIYHANPIIATLNIADENIVGNYILFPPYSKNIINYNCIHDRLSIKTDKFVFESYPIKEGRKYLLMHEKKIFNTVTNLNKLDEENSIFVNMLNYINKIMETENDISIVNYCNVIINKDYFISKKIKRKIFITI